MKIRALTIRAPQIHLVNAGLLTRLFRPAGSALDALKPGDLLWVREPFVLARQFDHLSPNAAAIRGAEPLFTSGAITGHLQPGHPRFARELLRVWHRQHLRVTAVQSRTVETITDAEIAEQGYALRKQFAAAWDNNLTLAKSTAIWSENPNALAIDFERIPAPIPAPVTASIGSTLPVDAGHVAALPAASLGEAA